MANFFLDNDDIRFHLSHIEWERIVPLVEADFADAAAYDYAPTDTPDAVDSYGRVLEMVGGIAAERIAPTAEDTDRQGATLADGAVEYSPGIARAIALLGGADLMGFTLPRRFGGLNMPATVYTMAIDIVSRADASLMNIFGLQGIAETIERFADESIRAKYLPMFCRGEVTGAMVLTEPDAGSDLQAVQLRATPTDGDEGVWHLSGVKRFITNGCAEVLLVLARSEPGTAGGRGLSLFLAERGPTIRIRRIEDKLGIHGSPTCEMQFNDTPAVLIGQRRRGLTKYTMSLMNGARLGVAAQGLGVAQAAFNQAYRYANERVQFGKRIKDMPPVAELLAEMKVDLEKARTLCYNAAVDVDVENGWARRLEQATADRAPQLREIKRAASQASRRAGWLTPLCKYYASEMANRVTREAISVLGGSGFMRDYPLERHYRDARIINIYEGTTQLQIVAAIGGITSGLAEDYFNELHEAFEDRHTALPEPGRRGHLVELAEMLRHSREHLAEAVDYMKQQDQPYLDLRARNAVDMAIEIVLGYYLLREAEVDDHKLTVAERVIRGGHPRIEMDAALILSGERSTLTHIDDLLGPVPTED
jgi:alkylation response protein AidB-like acyl-CoA dehydrogenase